jgi:hypothetical protein
MQETLLIPTVHRNGTSGKELLDQILEARAALRVAIKALQNACPNGRDYYVQGDRTIHQALEQHSDRLSKIQSVYSDLEQIATGIVGQEAK